MSIPEVLKRPPNHHNVEIGDAYVQMEERARPHIGEVAVVLVAGGLGERLGSSQIKISLTCEIMTGTSFIDLYLAYLKAYSKISGRKMNLFIMTSDDTHDQTVNLLSKKDFADYVNIDIEKQDKVPAFKDLDCQLDVNENLELQTKPHGHGDVHFLVRNSKVLSKWKKQGVKYVYFIQDTNPFSLPSLPAILSISIDHKYDLNFLAINRRPEEAIGALVADQNNRTFNIEYNVLNNYYNSRQIKEPVNENGFCLAPGNINCFLIDINEYSRILEHINDLSEFINPKFDKTRDNALMSSFRIECLMQDIAHSIGNLNKIAVSEFSRDIAFTTCKNNLDTGKANLLKGLSSETIIECENDIYRRNYAIMKYCKTKFTTHKESMSFEELVDNQRQIRDLRLLYCPRIFIHPSFGVFINDIKSRLQNVVFDVSYDFTLVLKGNVVLENCTFGSISLWIENKSKDPNSVLEVKNMRLVGENSDVIDFVSNSDDENDPNHCQLRRYKVDQPEKIFYIVSK